MEVCLCQLTRMHTHGVCDHVDRLFFSVSLEHLKALRDNKCLQLARHNPHSMFKLRMVWINSTPPPGVTTPTIFETSFVFDWVHKLPKYAGKAYRCYDNVAFELADKIRALAKAYCLETEPVSDPPHVSCVHSPVNFTGEGMVRRAKFRILVDISKEFCSTLVDILWDYPNRREIAWQRDLRLISYDKDVVAQYPICMPHEEEPRASLDLRTGEEELEDDEEELEDDEEELEEGELRES